jgi:subtilisin-like proprotein convertase family protein
VDLARRWTLRPPRVERRFEWAGTQSIPDDGLRVLLTGASVPLNLRSLPSTPGSGPHADDGTARLPVVDLGYATNDVTLDLRGRAALIQRGPPGEFADQRNTFRRKIERAAAAGAVLAVLYNNAEATNRLMMADTDLVPIPAVMISQNDGETLRPLVAGDLTLRAQIELLRASLSFFVEETLACEHVGVRLLTSHGRRGDLRVTLRSPGGTRSVLQRLNFDSARGPTDWTYWTVRHFGESGRGTWTLDVCDQAVGITGSITRAELILTGVAITDLDKDGLDDDWEHQWFGNLDQGPGDDPDRDHATNLEEFWAGTDPTHSDRLFQVWFAPWNQELNRLAWNSEPGRLYDVLAAGSPNGPFMPVARVPAQSLLTEWFSPVSATATHFFRVIEP